MSTLLSAGEYAELAKKLQLTTPFGGYRESGFGGRDKSQWAHEQYTELKTIWVDVPPAQ